MLSDTFKYSMHGFVFFCLIWLCPLSALSQGAGVRAVPEVLIYADAGTDGNIDGIVDQKVLIVDKSRQQINLYEFRGYWRNMSHWPCSTGKISGPKMMEGDQKTPEGIYFITRDVKDRYLSPTYGVRALPLDYPNWLDRRQDKSGSAIWLHGTNKPLQVRDSNGCVVLDNENINRLARHIRLQQTPVIIVERIRLCSEKQSAAKAIKILTAMDQWHRAMMYGDYAGFSHWYDGQNKPSMAMWQRWCRQRRKVEKDHTFRSSMHQRFIFRTDKVYVMLFDHVLKHDSKQVWAGRRKLYLTSEAGKVRIIGDTYQPGNQVGQDPLILACKRLYPRTDRSRKLASGTAGGPGG